MENQNGNHKTVQVEIRRAPNGLKIALIALILFSMGALVALRWVHNNIRDEIQSLTETAAAIEHANTVLEEKKGQIGSVQSIQDIAQEELGLADPDTILIDPQ